MKLLLSSAGIRNDELAKALSDLAGKPTSEINVAIINEAATVEPGDKTWMFNELGDLKKFVGGEFDWVDLLALNIEQIKQRLEFADVIYVVGGNPDYLAHLYRKTGFDVLLQDVLLDKKVYVGSSAGSMVMGRRASTKEYREYYGETRTFDTQEYLSLVDFVIKPHFESPELPNNHKDILLEASAKESLKLYAIRDDQAIVVVDNKLDFVGGQPFIAKPKL